MTIKVTRDRGNITRRETLLYLDIALDGSFDPSAFARKVDLLAETADLPYASYSCY